MKSKFLKEKEQLDSALSPIMTAHSLISPGGGQGGSGLESQVPPLVEL